MRVQVLPQKVLELARLFGHFRCIGNQGLGMAAHVLDALLAAFRVLFQQHIERDLLRGQREAGIVELHEAVNGER